jgi:hypothetical protein
MMRPLAFAAALLALAAAMPAEAQNWSSQPTRPAWAAPAVPSWSQQPLTPPQRNQLWLRGTPAEIQAVERTERGRAFQSQQQLNREIDRSVIGTAPMDLKVPVIKNKCMKRVFGNKFVASPCK